jgi:serine protein kinase
MKTGQSLMQLLAAQQEAEGFRELHWRGTFQDYLDIVTKNPKVARTAFQSIYDMILSYGYRP